MNYLNPVKTSPRRLALILGSATWLFAATSGKVAADEPDPALTARLVRPREQAERVISLFRDSSAPDPAAALAGWKRATRGRLSLGKSNEALIAFLNPHSARELDLFDGAALTLGFDPLTGQTRWCARMPRDDGTLAAFVASIALTDGSADLPINGLTVLRLSPTGLPVAVRAGDGLVVASTRQQLLAALDERKVNSKVGASTPSGVELVFDPEKLRNSVTLNVRRVAAALGKGPAHFSAGVQANAVSFELSRPIALPLIPPSRPAIDPRWLDAIPEPGTLAAFAVAIPSTPAVVDTTFDAIDRVEKADLTRAMVVPFRLRLNMIAGAAGVRPEIDLWPKIVGVSGFVAGPVTRGLSGSVVVHMADAPSASRLVRHVLPQLSSRYLRTVFTDEAGAARVVVNGVTFDTTCEGSDVRIRFGPKLAADARAMEPSRSRSSAGQTIQKRWEAIPPQRAGAIWPCRLMRLADEPSALADVLRRAAPIVWIGQDDAKTSRDRLDWSSLDALVRAALDSVPFDVPPDGAGIAR